MRKLLPYMLLAHTIADLTVILILLGTCIKAPHYFVSVHVVHSYISVSIVLSAYV